MFGKARIWIPWVLVAATAVGGAVLLAPWVAGEISYAVATAQQEAARANLEKLASRDHLSPLFREVAKAVKPAVVEIRVTKRVEVNVPVFPDIEEFYRRFFGEEAPAPRSPQAPEPRKREYFRHGLGSGVIVDAAEGCILTNNHVVAGADELEVVLADKRTFQAEWVRTDPLTDLAVVKIKPDKLIAAPLGDSDKMAPGDWVLAIGAPRGLPQTVTAGIISAKGRRTDNTQMYQDYLQTDAAINRGNSGGPLVNMRGEVVGISNSIFTYSGGNEGIGFAIPSNMARRIMTQLVEKGEVTRGYLGVRIQNVDDKLAKSFNLPTTEGALVNQVAKDSPAHGRLKERDFIVSVDGRKTANVNQLRNVVAGIAPGSKVEVKVYRDGELTTVSLTIGAQPQDMAAAFGERPSAAVASKEYGLKVATMTEDLARKYGYESVVRGAAITQLDEGSDAAERGLAPGMVITSVDGKAIASAEEFRKLIAGKAEGVRLRVEDTTGAGRYVFITPRKQ
jgi:serine protease Do